MNFDNGVSYLNENVKHESISQNTLVDTFKKIFNIPNSKNYQYNEVTVFYQELLYLSKQLGLGDNISIETVYDGKIPEKVFTIHTGMHLDKKRKYSLSESIHKNMKAFSKSKGLQNFFNDVYILIK